MTVVPEGFAQLRVMVVDDNRHMRTLLCSILRGLRIKKLREVEDGESALAEISTFEPDILITDWHMEPMDGTTLVKTLRHSSVDTIRYLPIIMLSGHSDSTLVREARDCGVNDFLTKPVSAKSLLARLITITEHPRPFIKNENYFGPDRRRQDLGPPDDISERRSDVAIAKGPVEMSPDAALAS